MSFAIRSFLLFIILFPNQSFSAETIRVWNRLFENKQALTLLKRALEVTGGGNEKIQLLPTKYLDQGGAEKALVESDSIDLAMFAPSQWREENLLPVYIPVSRGLLGLRLCIISSTNKNAFSSIKNIQDFQDKKVQIVSGTSWPDTQILESAGLLTLTASKYQDLFSLVTKDGLKCFSRSLNEINRELKKVNDFSLTIDPHLLIHYDLPTLFFVSKKKPLLAKRIKKGLDILIRSKEFFRIFWRNHRGIFKKYNIRDRTVIRVKTPHLSEELKLMMKDEHLWLPSKL